MTLEEMKTERTKLWAKVEATEEISRKACSEWCDLNEKVQRIEAKSKLRAELLAELQAERCDNPNPNAGVTQAFPAGRWTEPSPK